MHAKYQQNNLKQTIIRHAATYFDNYKNILKLLFFKLKIIIIVIIFSQKMKNIK